jgi:hypothetical protein
MAWGIIERIKRAYGVTSPQRRAGALFGVARLSRRGAEWTLWCQELPGCFLGLERGGWVLLFVLESLLSVKGDQATFLFGN